MKSVLQRIKTIRRNMSLKFRDSVTFSIYDNISDKTYFTINDSIKAVSDIIESNLNITPTNKENK